MAIVLHRGLVIPVWAVAFCVIALSASPRVMPSLIALVGIAVIASTMPAIVRRLRRSRPRVEVLPAVAQDPATPEIIITTGTRMRTLHEALDARTVKADAAADLVRMDVTAVPQTFPGRPAETTPTRGRERKAAAGRR